MNYNFKELEPEILKFWQEKDIVEKAKEKNIGKKKYYFLDGPPYTSGKVHIGTAWNKSLKDMVLRYKRMQGFDVWDRAGYDMHGLPTAHAVQKKLKIKTKEEILEFGVDNFIRECEKLSTDNLKLMNEVFKSLGIWMDFDNAYQSMSAEFIDGVWWLIKKAHENNRLYEGLKTMTWCPDCATALAKHELEYEEIEEESIFLKFKSRNKDNEYLIIWTTTPWTIPFNLAVMVNPELEYVKCNVEGETWILAKALSAPFIKTVLNKELNVLETFKGEVLEGYEYIHPLEDEIKDIKEIKSNHPKALTVLMSKEYVDTSAGSGLVHCAPGCGPEDYEVGHANNIPPFNNLNEIGQFPENTGTFSNKIAKKDDKKFIEHYEELGCLITTVPVEHDYAHCWRCKTPVIYKTTKQWFFKIEDLKEKMIEENKKIKWQPKAAFNAFNSWLSNLRDNSITKQRFWGTPLPVWRCEECKKYEVIGSSEELKEKAGKLPENVHKPWIDEITIPCECGKTMTRIPDIIDVWVDAGSASWNCLDYPRSGQKFEEMFPADFITEGKDQIRGWFNLLMVTSMVAIQKPSFKSCYMHGFIQDSQGRKMSKSVGNYILPEEVLEQYGADTIRNYFIGGANPGVDLNYNFDDIKVKYKNLSILWNLHKFVLTYVKDKDTTKAPKLGLEEKYILSKLNSTIKTVTQKMENMEFNQVPAIIEDLYLELSRTYVQLIRDKANLGTEEEKQTIAYTMQTVITETLKLLAPIMPFVTERMFLNFKETLNLEEDSIHLFDWPKSNEDLIDTKLEEQFEIMKTTNQQILNAREKMQRGVRWPIKEVIVLTKKEEVKEAVESLKELIKTQTNVKEITFKDEVEGITETAKVDFKKLESHFGNIATLMVAKFTQTTMEIVMGKIQEHGAFIIEVNDQKYEVTKEHLMIEKHAPENYEMSTSRFAEVYLSKETTDELEAEGFSREIVRRIQVLRKKSKLTKEDKVNITLTVSDELEESLKPLMEQIQEKVGASHLGLSSDKNQEEYHFKSEEKIKAEIIEIGMDKL
jgi:isoleucyl-tRNA synthetase